MLITEEVGHWEAVENRRLFLISFATKMGFDPLVASNWQTRQSAQLRAHGVRNNLSDEK